MSSTGWIIIAVVVIVVLVIGFVARSRRRSRDLAMRRVAAAAHRDEAAMRSTDAHLAQLEADEQAARAERARLQAEETAARADQARTTAQEHQALATEIDPDGEGAETATASRSVDTPSLDAEPDSAGDPTTNEVAEEAPSDAGSRPQRQS